MAAPYVPPAGIGAPGRRESAGTRGCVFGNPAQLVALMPEDNIGLTTAAYPRFSWYLPVNQARFVEFILTKEPTKLDSDGTVSSAEIIYQTRFAVTGEAGITSLQLPEMASIPPLVVGDRYRWQVAVFCNASSPNGDLQVNGWIQRQQPDDALMAELATASALEKANLYARNGYWFDAIDQFTILQVTNPEDQDLQMSWAELLESVDLAALAGQPFAINE